MKRLSPLTHAVLDYAWAGTMMASPWLFGFRKNRTATIYSVGSAAAIVGMALMTRYPLGAAKVIPFKVHGVIEAAAGAMTAGAPWLLGYSKNRNATLAHLIHGLATVAVDAMTDYEAARWQKGERGAGMAEQLRNFTPSEPETVDLGPPSYFTTEAGAADRNR
ncbi:MAG TPA: SPW repeat protein [Blastocatellia bacterium]|nr:SPW repeat protein [Blastocatellia bacterium]